MDYSDVTHAGNPRGQPAGHRVSRIPGPDRHVRSRQCSGLRTRSVPTQSTYSWSGYVYRLFPGMGCAQLLVGVAAGLGSLSNLYNYFYRPTKGGCVPVQVHADEADVFCRGGRIGYDIFGFGDPDQPLITVIIKQQPLRTSQQGTAYINTKIPQKKKQKGETAKIDINIQNLENMALGILSFFYCDHYKQLRLRTSQQGGGYVNIFKK